MKVCKKCDFEKNIIEFSNDKNTKDGKSLYCKECEKIRKNIYRNKNRDKINEDAKNWRINNPEKYKKNIEKYLNKNPHMTSTERSKKYREQDEWKEKFKESSKKYYYENLDKMKEKNKEYYHANKKKLLIFKYAWAKKKYKNDGFFRLKKNIRGRIRDYMKGEHVGVRIKDIVGIDYNEFRDYISSKFIDGMSWENYGVWHLDHIIPLCSAKNKEEVLLLNHYTNLQPLWAEENLKKGGKI